MPACAKCHATGHDAGSADCPAHLVGRTLAGKFELTHLLGAGGMGAVFEAIQHPLEIRVAIKTLLPSRHNTAAVQRFFQEAQAAARIGHPGIVKVTDLDQDGDMVFLVMERLRGGNLQDLLEKWGGQISPGHALAVTSQVLDALDFAHDRGIIHRDLKPSNLFLTEEKPGSVRVKLLDFGLAKIALLQPHSRLTSKELPGTALYMSWEQAERPGDADARSDVYSMGVVLFEMLTGRLPTENFIHALAGKIERHPGRHGADVPPGVDALCARALAFDPADRFPDARTMRQAAEAEARLLLQKDPLLTEQDLLWQLYQRVRPAEQDHPHPRPIVSLPGGTTRAGRQPALQERRRPSWRRAVPAAVILLGVLVLGYRLARPLMMPENQMARIPGGTFTMGSTPSEVDAAHGWCERQYNAPCDRTLYEREAPARKVRLSPFQLDRTEVTFSRFAEWLNRRTGLRVTNRRLVYEGDTLLVDLYPYFEPTYPLKWVNGRFQLASEFAHMPMTQLTWEAARRYCGAQGKRLPTEAEWEFAARGAEGRRFPWGDQEPECGGTNFGRERGMVCAVLGRRPSAVGTSVQDRTPEGVYDLAGNASEWVADRFVVPYPACDGECVDPRMDGPERSAAGPDLRVYRGGNWNVVGAVCRGAARSQSSAGMARPTVGFRCAR